MRAERDRARRRQAIRRMVLIVTFLSFPVVLNYFSPYVIVDAAARGVVNGSLLVFASLFVLSLFVGRAWCGWACPAAGLQEFAFRVVDRPTSRRGDAVKWIIWLPWVSMIAILAIRSGGYQRLDALYMTTGGLSVVEPASYIVYYMVLALVVIPCLVGGRRGFCHYICWMAPFMILGRWLRNAVGWPALRLRSNAEECTGCEQCTRSCPMSLPVAKMVQAGRMEHPECVLCGTCVDVCPRGVTRFDFGHGR